MKPNRIQLESALRESSERETAGFMALNSVMENEVKWFGGPRSVYRLGICRVNESSGGVVIMRFNPGRQKPYSQACFWERWYADIKAGTSEDPELVKLRSLAHEVCEFVYREQNKNENTKSSSYL